MCLGCSRTAIGYTDHAHRLCWKQLIAYYCYNCYSILRVLVHIELLYVIDRVKGSPWIFLLVPLNSWLHYTVLFYPIILKDKNRNGSFFFIQRVLRKVSQTYCRRTN